MPIRNPFTRRPGASVITGDSNRSRQNLDQDEDMPSPSFERVTTVGSKASSSLSIRTTKSNDTGEYKMSVVNDSGVYLPPSPTEEKAGAWPNHRKLLTRNSTDTRSSFGDIEHFSISRESFDSYRRSFDISAKSPITAHETQTRQSLDSCRYPRLPRSAMERRVDHPLPTAEENFEDVGLDDHKQQPRKRGFFSKLAETQDKDGQVQPGVTRFLIPSRKRGQSGQGAELGSMDYPRTLVEEAR